jgi:hypothetical protein
MFGELPKLLDRNYAIGFFLPAALIGGILWWILCLFGLVSPVASVSSADQLLGGVVAIGVVWLSSILLMAINYPAFRILEGYGERRNPLRLNLKRARRRFEMQALPALQRQAAYEKAVTTQSPLPHLPATHATDLRQAIELYPDDVKWILPTKFGNRMRAIEVYARAVYGLDSVPAWPRIQGLLSAEFKELLNASKAQLDFCVNLVAGGTIVAVVFAGLTVYQRHIPSLWPIAAAAAMIFVGYALAIQSVRQYGLYVRSAFDLYRGPLAVQLGFDLPVQPEREQEMWRSVSRIFIYRAAKRFLDLREFRMKRDAPAPKGADDGSEPDAITAAGSETTGRSRWLRLLRSVRFFFRGGSGKGEDIAE